MTIVPALIPLLAVLGSIVSLCVGTSFGKALFPIIGPSGTAAIRVIFAAFVLIPVFQPWKQPISFKSMKVVALYGLVLAVMNSIFYESIQRLPLGIAIAIEFTGPLTVAIASSRRVIDFVWIALAAIGLALLLPIAPGAVALDPLGICFAFAAAVLWALYIVLGKKMADLPSGQATALGVLCAGLVLMPVGIVKAGPHILEPQVLIGGFFLCLASSAIPYTLEMWAMKKLPKNTFSILLSMEPAVGALSGMVVLHESLTILQWVAVCSVMVASIGTTLTARTASADTANLNESIAIPADVL
ncbi:MAG: DMT family transporter [Cyanobacteria bacterium SZAS-4]|nr:DMT family transporter [Cyanobacteria bacterium SZAS-4]